MDPITPNHGYCCPPPHSQLCKRRPSDQEHDLNGLWQNLCALSILRGGIVAPATEHQALAPSRCSNKYLGHQLRLAREIHQFFLQPTFVRNLLTRAWLDIKTTLFAWDGLIGATKGAFSTVAADRSDSKGEATGRILISRTRLYAASGSAATDRARNITGDDDWVDPLPNQSARGIKFPS